MLVSYEGLEGVYDERVPHLGGSAKVGDPYTWCPSVWDYVVARFGIRSALDLGSGCGNAALYLHRHGVHVIAIEGCKPSVVASLYPAIAHDLTTGPVFTKVDLVHCQEVVEHIEEAYLDNLLRSLLTGKIILMTHALPGQGGYHHVNCQPQEYWVSNLTQRGAALLEADTLKVRDLAKQDGAVYMANTGLVFANSNSP